MLLVIEGLLPAVNPGLWKRMLLTLSEAPERHLRLAGLGFLVVGAFVLYLIN